MYTASLEFIYYKFQYRDFKSDVMLKRQETKINYMSVSLGNHKFGVNTPNVQELVAKKCQKQAFL